MVRRGGWMDRARTTAASSHVVWRKRAVVAVLLWSSATLTACSRQPAAGVPVSSGMSRELVAARDTARDAAHDAAHDAARDTAWKSLVSLEHWRGYQSQDVPSGWSVVDGAITKTGVGEDIVSRAEYGDFELEFDWMLDARGNSGVFYRATEEYDKIYWSAPEYALLDDARHPDGRNPLTSAGAAHSLYAPPPGVVRPAGEWNSTRIVVQGTRAEHWLNGARVVAFDYASSDFARRVAESKFGRWPNFAKADRGVIGIQGDHGGRLAIRGIRLRTLD